MARAQSLIIAPGMRPDERRSHFNTASIGPVAAVAVKAQHTGNPFPVIGSRIIIVYRLTFRPPERHKLSTALCVLSSIIIPRPCANIRDFCQGDWKAKMKFGESSDSGRKVLHPRSNRATSQRLIDLKTLESF